ncbi:MAG: hypothetical protein J6Y08_07220 [Clostridiales bacterium]|nr:hypothetical protein [Clostridiales bacterium]
MRRTARENRSTTEVYEEETVRAPRPSSEIQDASYPKSTIENPLMEELHTVSAVSAPAWKTPSVVVSSKPKDTLDDHSMFTSIDADLSSSSDGRPIAPSTATIITEKEVKERFSYSDEQLEYRPGMSFGERTVVTLRKIAVWFSDQWDKYTLFMKKHFPFIYEGNNTTVLTVIGLLIFFVLVAIIAISASMAAK